MARLIGETPPGHYPSLFPSLSLALSPFSKQRYDPGPVALSCVGENRERERDRERAGERYREREPRGVHKGT